jgi:hypothetical protein
MATASSSPDIDRGDLMKAIGFAQSCFLGWQERGVLRPEQYQDIVNSYSTLRGSLEAGEPIPDEIRLPSANRCWSCKRAIASDASDCDECGAPAHTSDTERLRHLIFVCFEIKRFQKDGHLTLAAADACLAECNERIAALRRKLDAQRIPTVLAIKPPGGISSTRAAAPAAPPANRPSAVQTPPSTAPEPRVEPSEKRRNIMEMLLDPRSLQWLMVSGAVLLVFGLVIWLAAEGIFKKPEVLAVCMGVANAALLAGGWAVIGYTRHQMAGRALTLLACLLMPLNLWFYDAQGLITIAQGGHLWIPALVCCVLYAVSARLLRDPMFVYVLVGGVALTGLLMLADHQMQHFWEIAGPSSLLVCLGLLGIHAERVFPEGEGEFSRRRFGLAFFWSGHAVLAAGLLLLLGAQACGDWLYFLFQPLYAAFDAGQPAIVTTEGGKLLALCLVLAGTYVYAYSDLVVRRVGVYIYLAGFCLLWSEVLILGLLPWKLPVAEVAIITLAVTALVANLSLTLWAGRDSRLLRGSAPLGLLLSALPVIVGIVLHFRASSVLAAAWPYTLTWTYVAAMLTAALSCRTSAHLFRHSRPGLSLTYFFGTGAATLVGAAGLLLVLKPDMRWEGQAPLLMLIPLLYLGAARLYRGHTPERPLLWVAHAATIVLLISSVGAAFEGFFLIEGATLNLALAAFFAEATLFYLSEALWRKHAVSVYACTITACAAVWQLFKYGGVAEEYYILTFAIVGFALLVAYRFAVLESLKLGNLARAAFQSGNALLSLAFVAGALMVLSRLIAGVGERGVLIPLLSGLLVIGLLAVAIVRQPAWRRWYTASAITNVALIVLVLAILGHLTPGQKLEIACVTIGLLLLVVGHLGWYREQEQQNDLVTTSLFFGSALVALPLAIAVLYCRSTGASFDTFHTLNELGMLAAGLLLLATGFMGRIKSTTIAGASLMVLYLGGLVLFLRVPDFLKTTAVYIMVGGGLFFTAGLLLSLYRDRLLALPERIKRREGVFHVLTWR